MRRKRKTERTSKGENDGTELNNRSRVVRANDRRRREVEALEDEQASPLQSEEEIRNRRIQPQRCVQNLQASPRENARRAIRRSTKKPTTANETIQQKRDPSRTVRRLLEPDERTEHDK